MGGDPIAVLGAGAWGTTLAIVLARNGEPVVLWGRDGAHMQRLARERRDTRYLCGAELPEPLRATSDLPGTIAEARDILVAVPSDGFRELLETIVGGARPDVRLGWATKGLDPQSGRLLHEVAADVFGESIPRAVLSGPTFAREIALALPAAVTIASTRMEFAGDLKRRFHSDRFRVYTSPDIIGLQIGGAVKNVLALAAGIADGLGFGANLRAALITRGLAELMRLGVALGADRSTLMGLSGLGDLVLTCTDDQSRNRRAGLVLGRGGDLAAVRAQVGPVIEGIIGAAEVMRLARRVGVEMPISEQVEQVLYAGRPPQEAVRQLLHRAAKDES